VLLAGVLVNAGVCGKMRVLGAIRMAKKGSPASRVYPPPLSARAGQ
jgi:hypothetical protein